MEQVVLLFKYTASAAVTSAPPYVVVVQNVESEENISYILHYIQVFVQVPLPGVEK